MPTEKKRVDYDKKKPSKSQSSRGTEENIGGRNVKRVSKEPTEPRKRRDDSRSNNKSEKPTHRKEKPEENEKKVPKRDQSVDKMKKSRSYHETRTDSNNRTSRTHQTKDDSSTSKINKSKEKTKISHSIERNVPRQHRQSTDLPPERKKSEVILTGHKKSSNRAQVADSKARAKPLTNLGKSKSAVKVANDEVKSSGDVRDEEMYEDDFEDYDSDFESDEEVNAEEEFENEIKHNDYEDDDVKFENTIQNDAVIKSFQSEPVSVKVKAMKSVNFENYFSTIPNEREKENVLLAMKAENEFVKEFKERDKSTMVDSMGTGKSVDQNRPVSSNFINFSSAKQRQTARSALNKSMVRKMELFDSQRISMSEMHFDIYDLPPIDYEAYIKSFGRTNTKQIYCQTNDDDLTEEIQTDDLDLSEKWTQHPALGRWCSGGDAVKNLDAEELENSVKSDSVRLSKFIQLAGELVISLLEENTNEIDKDNKYDKNKAQSSFSLDSYRLGELPFRKSCPVTFVQFSVDEPHFLLTIHAAAEDELVEDLPELGVICVWNIYQPLYPQKILSSHSQPLCCCFNPGKANLAFAGLMDGSVLLWDLREPSNIHRKIAYDGHDFVLRTSTYNTAEILRSESHRSPVVSIRSVQMDNDFSVSSLTSYSEQQLTFKVASLEEYGVLKLWTCIEVAQPDLSGNDADLGLAPGSRIRLIRSQTIDLRQFPSLDLQTRRNLRSLDLQFLPNDSNQMFIATDVASVLHCDSNGSKLSPAIFKSDETCEVKSLVFCSWSSPICFLVGCSNGTIRLHSVNKEKSLISWPNVAQGQEILSVCWAGSSLFYVLDAASCLHCWDLHQNQYNPTFTQKFEKHKITSFHANGGRENGKKTFQIAIAFDDGAVEIHQIPSSTNPNIIPLDLM